MNAAQLQAKAIELSQIIPLHGNTIRWARNPHYEEHLMYTICQSGVIDVEDAQRLFSLRPNWSRSRTNEATVLGIVLENTFVSGTIPWYKIAESVKRRIKARTTEYLERTEMSRVDGERWSECLSRQRSNPGNLWFACMYDLLQDHAEFDVSRQIPGVVFLNMQRERQQDREVGAEALEEREMIQSTMKAELEHDLKQDQLQARREMAELRRAVEDIERTRRGEAQLQHHRARRDRAEQRRAPPPPPAAPAQAPQPAQVPAGNVVPDNAAAVATDRVRARPIDHDDPPVQQEEGWIKCGICHAVLPDDGGAMAEHLSTCLGTTDGTTMGSCPICDEAFASSMSTLAREQHVQACCDGGPALRGLGREHAIFAATSETIPRDSTTKQPQECIICLEDFEIGEDLARLSCYCVMHSNCIEEYWERPGTFCPTHRDDQPGQKA
ncbi:hypothetical protein, variant [Microbotryum lychnidis-dioicae p1A1 Lamole]|uniref:RING-type E3 ubiquitin transferase n=1 Tax=Microbotryum lychnidis-dioicae (strain p1A1 Lamole / MvSl-1064) TaxID=683840 RepID=U5H1R2_USTV1|nr:hypothetical protein MVLG_01314 [Microbotryum lychnidis-dioicae p1A1 Lamole]KDE08537.1 hypothetical protein, variant [Microbotryum lychnidis-dioicae p1A1 Lamole]|eukprot:KDE08536.1 hypothetical protein MVLG_01314 [Microbotryum lychnidis-dioicae p1A1 Lamole]